MNTITSDLPADPSLEEIETEQVFFRVLLDTLDVDDEDFHTKRAEYEAQISHLDHLHHTKEAAAASQHASRRLETPPRPMPNPSFSLPSRERHHAPTSRPSAARSPTMSSSDMRRKHKRSSLSAGAPSNKAQKTSAGRASEFMSDFSDDEDTDRALGSGLMDEFQNKYRDRVQARSRATEERYRQELADRKLAYELSLQADDSGSASHSTPPVARNPTQARLAENGSFERNQRLSEPVNPRPLDIPSSPETDMSIRQTLQRPVHSPAPRPLDHRRATPAPSTLRYSTGSSSSDDVEFLSASRIPQPTPTGSLVRQQPGTPIGKYASGSPFALQMPGTYPSLYTPYQHNTFNYGTMAALKQQTRHVLAQQAQQQPYGYPYGPYATSGANGTYHGAAGAPVFDNSPYPGYRPAAKPVEDPTAFGPNEYSEEQLTDLRERGMFGLIYDASRSKDEILKLLETIRPDEEIPAQQRLDAPPDLQCVLMEHQKLGLSWLKKQEEGPNKGSILADDMGLGKTIQALALILARKSTDVAVKTTLIIAPVALMRQWQKEIETKVVRRRPLKVIVLHGPRKGLTFAKLSTYDVVLTTYGKLAHEWRQKSEEIPKVRQPGSRAQPQVGKYPLLGDECTWYRVILDEAQAIKNRQTKTSVAAHALKSHYRLCMTGTPMMNNTEELFALIRFLRIPPYNVWEHFNKDLARPLAGKGPMNRDGALRRLQAVIRALLLRRNKDSKIDGKPILTLPPRVTEIKHAVFGEEQKSFYDALEKNAQVRFNAYLDAGTVNRNYTNALVLLLRLRQCCDHPHLIADRAEPAEMQGTEEEQEDVAKQFSDDVVTMIRDAKGAFECPICYDAADNPTIFFPCGHDVCAECFTRLSDPSNMVASGEERQVIRCPECRSAIDVKKIIRYQVFKRVRLPELCTAEELEGTTKEEADVDDDESSDSESDSGSDADGRGNLRGFIVNDDEGEEDEMSDDGSDEVMGGTREADKRRKKPAKGKGKARRMPRDKKPAPTLAELKAKAGNSMQAKKRYLRRLRKKFVTSAKIDKTLEIMKEIRDRDGREKTIVFSQFTTFLDLLEVPIDDNGWKWSRYDGSMSAVSRNAAVDRFEDEDDCNIMLISLKAGNAGLNLNWASQVIILDPFWNPFVEEQAIDRAHRIGQQRPVTVHRLLIEETVEDRIVALQEKKRELVNAALDESAGKSLSRLGVQQLSYLFGLRGNAVPT